MAVFQRSLIHLDRPLEPSEPNILVINATEKMASQVTDELQRTISAHTLWFAPSLSVAKLLLTKRVFSLIIADGMLPDGAISTLQEFLLTQSCQPDLIVVGEESQGRQNIQPYSLKRTSLLKPDKSLEQLGADLRNDLNNPLQEIVAMAFVARQGGELSSLTQEALDAIERAANSMADVVWGIESTIKKAIG